MNKENKTKAKTMGISKLWLSKVQEKEDNTDVSPSWITALLWWGGLCNSMKLWVIPCRANMDVSQWRVLANCGPLEEGVANHSSILALRTKWTAWKGKNIWHQKTSTHTPPPPPPPRSGVQYATGEESRNSSKKNEEVEPKQKWHSVVDVLVG